MKPQEKGESFESQVEQVLQHLKRRNGHLVSYRSQPRIKLYNGRVVIPDFELTVTFVFERSQWLIECQDRKRSKPAIADKISMIKSLSRRNRAIFVYRDEIPEATRKALESDGCLVLSFLEFVKYVTGIDMQLEATARSQLSGHGFLNSLSDLKPEERRKIVRLIRDDGGVPLAGG